MNIEDKLKDKVETTPVDARVSKTKSHKNTVRLLCSLTLSVLCWVFVRASFLQNPGKMGHLSLTEGCI